VKRLIALLLVVAAGLVLAAFTIPNDAATVNGVSISQATLNEDITAIAGSRPFQCYLAANEAVRTNGQGTVAPIHGVGESNGTNGTYNTAFVSQWLSQLISGQVVAQLVASRHVTVTVADVDAARADLTAAINATFSRVQGSQFACPGVSASSVYASLPSTFVDSLVHAQAVASALASSQPGSGVSQADIARYVAQHGADLANTCVTAVPFQTQAAAEAFAAQVAGGASFSTLASQNAQTVTGCSTAAQSPIIKDVAGVPVGTVSPVINYQNSGTYIVVQVTKRSAPTVAAVSNLVRQLLLGNGQQGAARAITAATRVAHVTVDPRYGRWSEALSPNLGVITPVGPPASTLLNPTVNAQYPPNGPSGTGLG